MQVRFIIYNKELMDFIYYHSGISPKYIFYENFFCLGVTMVCPTICNRMYLPVCGSDGETYGNECNLRYDQCNVQGKSNLTIVAQGRCPSS